jgi:hypothetical protein
MSELRVPVPSVAVPRAVALGGVALFVLALLLGWPGVWHAALFAIFGLATIGLGGALFTALHHVTGARWGRSVLPVAHATMAILPFAGLSTLILGFGASSLWPWADPAVVAADHHVAGRTGWMNTPFVLGRQALCYAVWILLGGVLVRRSRGFVATGDEAVRRGASVAAAWFLVGFAPTFTVAAIDLVLSLDRSFANTIVGIQQFSGTFLAGIAIVTTLSISAARRGALGADPLSEDVLHDLGKLLFAFAFFWGYIWYCQHMLVWYTNLPEETGTYATRHAGAWEPLSILNVVLNWAVPFVVLLSARAKRRVGVLRKVCAVVLAGRVLDLHLAILQPGYGAGFGLRVAELALGAGAIAGFLWSFRVAFAREPIASSSRVPVRAAA